MPLSVLSHLTNSSVGGPVPPLRRNPSSRGAPRPGILRRESSYGPNRHPLDMYNEKESSNTKSNAEIRPLPKNYPRTKASTNQHQRKVRSIGARRVSFGSPSENTCPPDESWNTDLSERNERFFSDPTLTKSSAWLDTVAERGERSQSLGAEEVDDKSELFPASLPVEAKYVKILRRIAQLLPRPPGNCEAEYKMIHRLIDVDALMHIHLEDDTRRTQLQSSQGKQRSFDEGHILCVPLRTVYFFASDLISVNGLEYRLPIFLVEAVEALYGRDLSGSKLFHRPQRNPSTIHNFIDQFDAPPLYGKGAVLQDKSSQEIFSMLRHFLEAMPEPMLEPTLFHAFYQSCYLPTRAMADSKTGTAEATGNKTNRTSDELSRIAIAKLLFRLMPEAHSSALTYLLAFFALIPTVQNKRTYKELAKVFGPSICSPRDPFQHFIALGALPDNSGTGLNKENAEKWIRQMGSQLLLWLLCYWDEISSWRDIDPTFDTKGDADVTAWFQESQTGSKRVYASPEAAEDSLPSSDSVPSEYSEYLPLESVTPLKLGVSGKEAMNGHGVHDPCTSPTSPIQQRTPEIHLQRLDQLPHPPDIDQQHSHEEAGLKPPNPIDRDAVARLESLVLSQNARLRTKDDMIAQLETRISALEQAFFNAEISALTERLDRVEEESSGTAKKLRSLRSAL